MAHVEQLGVVRPLSRTRSASARCARAQGGTSLAGTPMARNPKALSTVV
ncbi:MAG: hypothetical protein IPI43_14655 [Sandaracinaceae bacterium]|nr:hypothetical protein [Sandaracinaceae bacterium]